MTEQFPEQEQNDAPGPDTEADAGDVDQDAQPTSGPDVSGAVDEETTDVESPGTDLPE